MDAGVGLGAGTGVVAGADVGAAANSGAITGADRENGAMGGEDSGAAASGRGAACGSDALTEASGRGIASSGAAGCTTRSRWTLAGLSEMLASTCSRRLSVNCTLEACLSSSILKMADNSSCSGEVAKKSCCLRSTPDVGLGAANNERQRKVERKGMCAPPRCRRRPPDLS